jgi:hypothetical protein
MNVALFAVPSSIEGLLDLRGATNDTEAVFIFDYYSKQSADVVWSAMCRLSCLRNDIYVYLYIHTCAYEYFVNGSNCGLSGCENKFNTQRKYNGVIFGPLETEFMKKMRYAARLQMFWS